jgi:hypothetical protein
VWLLVALAAVGAVYWLVRRRRKSVGAGGRVAQATELRRRLIRRVHNGETADRLAEAELRRDPGADMATCYSRALQRLDKDRR